MASSVSASAAPKAGVKTSQMVCKLTEVDLIRSSSPPCLAADRHVGRSNLAKSACPGLA